MTVSLALLITVVLFARATLKYRQQCDDCYRTRVCNVDVWEHTLFVSHTFFAPRVSISFTHIYPLRLTSPLCTSRQSHCVSDTPCDQHFSHTYTYLLHLTHTLWLVLLIHLHSAPLVSISYFFLYSYLNVAP